MTKQMMKSTLVRALMSLGALTFGTGCVVDTTFDPTSDFETTVAALTGGWTVGGAAASSENCDASGIASVELRVYDSASAEYHSDEDQSSLCATGALTTAAHFLSDSYRVQWVATDESDEVVWQSRFETITVAGETVAITADLPSIPDGFSPRGTSASLQGEWQIEGASPTASSCEARSIAIIQLAFYDEGGTSPYTDSDFSFACETGSFVRPNSLAAGGVRTQWRALNAAGIVVAEEEIEEQTLSPGASALVSADF